MMWLLWEEDSKIQKNYWHSWLNKQLKVIKRKFLKTLIVSRKPYNKNEYVKLGTCNFAVVKDYTYHGTILTNKN
jgi:hypothetical protein